PQYGPGQPPYGGPPGFPPGGPAPPGPPPPGPAPFAPRGRRFGTALVTLVVTLLVAVSVTGAVVYMRGDFRAASQPVPADLPEDPCASVDEARLDAISAEPQSMHIARDTSHCSWDARFDGLSDATLRVSYTVPATPENAALLEEHGAEPKPDPEELYADRRDDDRTLSGDEVVEEQDEPQDYGDESTIVYVHARDPDTTFDFQSVSAALLIRDGDRVTEIEVSEYEGALDFSQAEDLLTELAGDVEWQAG
ncbi:hypothetical protein, partial [Allosalinactinospora lopnorensis]|uniref:hypothetical protein n=1 Tax=Allosalinactinospora lopnorensis TaxID=1352348 RepID=UPI001F47904B